MLIDYHWHTSRCGHAEGTLNDFVAMARKSNLTEVGFADHLYQYFLPPGQRDRNLAMTQEEFPCYIGDVQAINAPGINVRLGVEADYLPGWENTLSGILQSYPFDYVIGSVHHIDGWMFDSPGQVHSYARHDLMELYRRYFDLVAQAARSGIFDIIAHPDLIKKFGFRPEADLTPLYDHAARAMAEGGVCVEVNTAGLSFPAREIYPALDFLARCRAYGVSATLGSDAHAPGHVGRKFREAKELLVAAGYSKLTVFKKRKRSYVNYPALKGRSL